MNLIEIERNVKKLIDNFKDNKQEFIYELLLCYGIPKSSISRLKNGSMNLSKKSDEVLWKKKLFFKVCKKSELYKVFTSIKEDKNILKNEPRFIIITDYDDIIAIDTKTLETLNINISNIEENFTFFLPWAGMEKAILQRENPADIRAAAKMMKLYDSIKKYNNFTTSNEIHGLNIFIARLLFCFFAEDTGIFKKKIFTKCLASYTKDDGSDLNEYFKHIFRVLNEEKRDRALAAMNNFPFVGGGLFREEHIDLKFDKRSRQAIIESGELNWSDINPDIFGSMIQAVVKPDERNNFGMHYTSVPNIMRVINPLLLEELEEELERDRDNVLALKRLINKLSKIKVFDPACGSGNFLIIAYRELRKFEMKIIDRINEISNQQYLSGSTISINQFYGIEIDDFAHEIASLSLWLIEHKMNMEFYSKYNYKEAPLPLKNYGNIIHGNATTMIWDNICSATKDENVFVLGNPPYVGSKKQTKEQKKDMESVFKGIKGYKNLDYVSCWFFIAAKYLQRNNGKVAFVSTDSIVQGDQVGLLWPNILKNNIEIGFAHTSFKWANNATNSAGVSCVIIGIQKKTNKMKSLISEGFIKKVSLISPYLTADSEVIVTKRTNPISNLPKMSYGNMPLEGGFLKLSRLEKDELENSNINACKFIRPVIGGDEFLKGYDRYCLWIDDNDLEEAVKIKGIKERIEKVREFRENGGEVARTLVSKAHQFRYRNEAKNNFIVVPCTSSERREYLPCGLFDSNYISLNSIQVVNDAELYVFGILSSKLHMLWVKTVGGRLKTDYRYSNMICYNTFPIPEIKKSDKLKIENCVYDILFVREKYSEKTIGQLYDPDDMPQELRNAHYKLDEIIEKCYSSKGFKSDEERLECLFKLYDNMVN